MTKQQQVIMDVIMTAQGHLTADEIYRKAKERIPKIAVGTIYRNLGQMVENHTVRRFSVKGEPDHYDGNMAAHEHLICERCGQICDVEIEGLAEYIQKKTGEKLTALDLELKYICAECRNSISAGENADTINIKGEKQC